MDPKVIGKAATTGRAPRHSDLPADTPERVLGVDPGLGTTGYAVLQWTGGKLRVEEAGVIRARSRGSLAERVAEIYHGLVDVIASLHPGAMAIEELYSHYKRPRTAILMGHARGVICLAAAEAGIPVAHYAATQVKRILTGNGRASKGQMQRAVQYELSLAKLPEPPDVADALAIALCHHHLKNKPRATGTTGHKCPG
jgi:crossover junction endodeoxyribonuclease RuvC